MSFDDDDDISAGLFQGLGHASQGRHFFFLVPGLEKEGLVLALRKLNLFASLVMNFEIQNLT